MAAALAGLAVVACSTTPAVERMTQEKLEGLIRERASGFDGQAGSLEFVYDGVTMACISDVEHDRMRIIAPIAREADVSDEQRQRAWLANFHSALDARYASGHGILFAAYLHPLASLDEAEVVSALQQVANLVHTFGTTYSSGILVYEGPLAQ